MLSEQQLEWLTKILYQLHSASTNVDHWSKQRVLAFKRLCEEHSADSLAVRRDRRFLACLRGLCSQLGIHPIPIGCRWFEGAFLQAYANPSISQEAVDAFGMTDSDCVVRHYGEILFKEALLDEEGGSEG